MVKASKRMRVNGKIKNYSDSSILSIWSEGDSPTPVGFMTLAFSWLAPLWIFLRCYHPLRFYFQVNP